MTLGDRFRVRRMAARVWPEADCPDACERASAPEFEQFTRVLQSGGGSGVSGDSIALMLTALLGVGSFIVQAVTEKRAARAATATQKELDRELAAREAARTTAGVQLDRVRNCRWGRLRGHCSTRHVAFSKACGIWGWRCQWRGAFLCSTLCGLI